MSAGQAQGLGSVATARALVVDDNPANVRLLEMTLRLVEGLETITTTDPLAAEALFAEHEPDLVLLDLHMAPISGLDVMARLKGHTAPDDLVPIVVLTADPSAASRDAALSAGATDFLVKPLDPAEVTLRATNLLRLRALHRANRAHREELSRRLEEHEARARAEAERVASATQRIVDVIRDGSLRSVYQPIVTAQSRIVAGYEALSRFPAPPERTPDKWFAEAGELGLGRELESVAIASALTGLADLDDGQFLSLNLSPEFVTDGSFDDFSRGVDGGRVVVELTEHTRIPDYDALVAGMDRLRARGFSFAVDDAGAGYSSLSHILRLRPEWIKLDLALTQGVDRDPARRALASALVHFAREIGASTISEGVETEDELDTLVDVGINYCQGFHVGRPGPLTPAARRHPSYRGSAAGRAAT